MTRQEAAEKINAKYPKANIKPEQIDSDFSVDITVWQGNGDKDFFDFEGNYIGHKNY